METLFLLVWMWCVGGFRSEQLEAVKEELAVEREEVVSLKSRVDQLSKAKVCNGMHFDTASASHSYI